MFYDSVRQKLSTTPTRGIFPPHIVQQCKNALAMIGVALLAGLVAVTVVALVAPQALGAPATIVAGQGDGTDVSRDVTAGLFFRSGRPDALLEAPTLASEVVMTVSGQVTRVNVRQRFYNPSKVWQEGIYVFPLPEQSAVDRLVMTVGDRRVEGRILERAEARRVFEEAAEKGQHAGLVESERPNVFVTSVANVGPGDEVAIEIQYQDRVAFADGRFSLRFPMVVAPRYSPAAEDLPSVNYRSPPLGQPQPPAAAPSDLPPARPIGGEIQANSPINLVDQRADGGDLFGPVRHPDRGPANPIALAVALNPGGPMAVLESLYHEIAVAQTPDGGQRITLAETSVTADRDFVLEWSLAASETPEAAVFGEGRQGDGYLLIDIFPPNNAAAPETVLPGLTLPRDLIFVIDTSGSMHGPSMEQAKFALRQALERLGPEDRFNIIQFNDDAETVFADIQPVTPEIIARARAVVRRLEADGGTEMLPALRLALSDPAESGRLRQVVFLTDGAVGNEHELFQEIAARLGDIRLFTVGIGAAPNSYFMRKAAEVGRGSFTYIGDVAEVAERMKALFRKLETPVLTDLALDWSGTASGPPELYPSTLPDIYAGEPIQFTARVPDHTLDELAGTLRLRGRVQDGTTWERSLDLGTLASAPGVAAIWARAKFEQVEDGVFRGEDYDAVREAALAVALDYQLVTHLTSLVAVDDAIARPEGAPLEQSEIPRNLPEGWDYEKVFGEPAPVMPLRTLPDPIMRQASALGGQSFALPQGATPAGLMALIGLGLLCLTILLLLVAARLRGAPHQAEVAR